MGSWRPNFGRLGGAVGRSFRRKLAAALFVVFLVVGLLTVGLYVQVGGLLNENVERSMTAAASAEADELNEWHSHQRVLVRATSEHPVYESGDEADIRAYLRRQRSDRREATIVRAYVVDRRTQTVTTSADPKLEGFRVSELPWEERFSFRDFDDVQRTQPYQVENEIAVMGFIAPIRRMPESLLVVVIETSSLFDRFDHPVDGGFTRVVNSNGTIVFADERDVVLTQYRDGTRRAPIVGSGLRGEVGFTDTPTTGDAGGGLVAAYAPVQGSDWVVVEHAPAAEAYAIARQARAWIGGIAALALIALLGVVAVLGADVNSALARLTERAKQIENEEYDIAFETGRRDEFGDLNRALASTRETLHRRIGELSETKEDLQASHAALEERSTMVTVLNRILRHNVRNDVNVIAGRAEIAATGVEDEIVRDHLEIIEHTAWDLAEISKRTERLNQLLSGTESGVVSTDLDASLHAVLEEIGDGDADVTVTLDVEDGIPAAKTASMFPATLADVVDDIVAHADGPVRINVTVTEAKLGQDDVLVVRIDDDGAGLPDLDVHAVSAGEETPLQHAEGLALWCLEWTLAKTGGELDVDPEDATFEVRLPKSLPSDQSTSDDSA